MPSPKVNVKIFYGFDIDKLFQDINDFLSNFSTAEIKAISLTVSERILYVIIAFTVS